MGEETASSTPVTQNWAWETQVEPARPGPTTGGRPSTVIDVQGPIRIIRDGAIERGTLVAQLAAHGLHFDGDSP